MRLRVLALSCAMLACAPGPAFSQSRSIYSNLANPAIGMTALFAGQVAPDLDQPYGLEFDSAEISLVSPVDQFWLITTNITFTPEEVDPEEVWARTMSIPDISLKVGKIRGTFGKHGLLHAHAFPFIQAPVIMANTIGGEGFKDAGLEASWLTPAPWYMELTGGAYQAMEAGEENPLDFGSSDHQNVPFGGHLKNTFDLNDETTLEFGLSGLSGKGADGWRHSAYGADLTVRNVPARASNRRGWILSAEYIGKGTDVDGTFQSEARGWFSSFQYRFSQHWWMGVRGEQDFDSHTDVLGETPGGDPVTGDVKRGSANVAWTPSEFSYVRLEYSYTKADDGRGFEPDDKRLMLQFQYVIGYHPAHAY
jgi:hypothetical protein